jgi:hypothetical protein
MGSVRKQASGSSDNGLMVEPVSCLQEGCLQELRLSLFT